jgi:zinc-finger binding domain of transposase IS66
LPRERIVYPAPSSCPCCGGTLRKLGEDVTEMLELVPRQWKVIQHVMPVQGVEQHRIGPGELVGLAQVLPSALEGLRFGAIGSPVVPCTRTSAISRMGGGEQPN